MPCFLPPQIVGRTNRYVYPALALSEDSSNLVARFRRGLRSPTGMALHQLVRTIHRQLTILQKHQHRLARSTSGAEGTRASQHLLMQVVPAPQISSDFSAGSASERRLRSSAVAVVTGEARRLGIADQLEPRRRLVSWFGHLLSDELTSERSPSRPETARQYPTHKPLSSSLGAGHTPQERRTRWTPGAKTVHAEETHARERGLAVCRRARFRD